MDSRHSASHGRRGGSIQGRARSDAGGELDDRKKPIVEVTISSRNLRWKYLEEYLELEFPGVFAKDSQKTVLNECFIVALPRRLNDEELQDIDILRGTTKEAEDFLRELREENEERQGGQGYQAEQLRGQPSWSRLSVVQEDALTATTSRAGRQSGGGIGLSQVRSRRG